MTAPGLRLTRQEPAASAATVDLDAPPTAVHAALFDQDDLRAALVDAVLEAASGRTLTAFLDDLEAAEVDARGGAYARLLARVARGEWPAVRDLIRTTKTLGDGHRPLSDAFSPARVFAMADAVTPTLAVRLDRRFRALPAKQRRDVCRLLAELAQGADVRVVGTGLELRWLRAQHRTDLPTSVDESDITPLVAPPDPEHVPDLDPDGPQVRLLRVLADEPSGTLTYSELDSQVRRAASTVRYHVTQTLVPAGLVERCAHHGDAAVQLTIAGQEYVEDVDAEIGRQRSLGGWSESSVEDTGHSSDEAVLARPPSRGGEERPSHSVRYLGRPEHHATAGSAVAGDVVTVDRDVERAASPGSPGWSYDAGRDEMVVAAEYQNPMQGWVCVALALTDWRTFEHVLDADRLDAVLEERGRTVLRDFRQLGWLKADVETGEELAEALRDAADHLGELTRRLHHEDYEDRDRFRGAITRDALGLAGTMAHLLDVAGVDLVTEGRMPEFSRNFDEDRRADLAKTVAKGVAIQSTYGEFAAYRQQFERREKKRRTAMSPRVDAADPRGEVVSSFVLVGPGVEGLGEEIDDALADLEPHEDAPEFEVPVDIATPTRSAYEEVATRLLRWKKIRPTRDAVAFLHGLAASPYAAAYALSALSKEDYREARLDEVRYALSKLPSAELLPDALPSIRAMVSALLGAERPLTQTELADRAGVSTRSVRRHADRLAALDLVRREDDGWRLALSFHTAEERHQHIVPWYCTPNRDRDDFEDATVAGVLWRAVEELDPPPEEALLAGRGDVDGLRRAWPWLDGLLELLAALAVHEVDDEAVRTVTFGADVEQQRLPTVQKAAAD